MDVGVAGLVGHLVDAVAGVLQGLGKVGVPVFALLIGALMGLGLSGGWALLCIVGFCGGFTTFSTFSLETVTLLRAGSYLPAALYMWSSMVLSIAAVCGGYYLGTKFNTFE